MPNKTKKDKQQDKRIAKVERKIQKRTKQTNPTKKRRFPYGLSISDRDLISGTHQAINTIFYPQLGVHRGLARSFTESGLARVNGQFYTGSGTSSLFALTFQVTPSTSNASGWFKYEWGGGVGFTTPANVGAAISATQAVDYRVLGCEITITPQGAFTSQSGAGVIGYVPDISSFAYSNTTIANLAVHKDFKGVDPMSIHWIPAENESAFTPIGSSPSTSSAIVGTISCPTATAANTSFLVEYCLVYEFVPSVAYRPWVSKDKPSVDSRVYKYVNDYAEKHSDPLMIGRSCDYLEMLRDAVRHEGGLMSMDSVAAATNTSITSALNDNKNWFQHVIQGDLSGAGEHARALERGAAVGLLNNALGLVNTVIPGDQFDIPYLGS